MQQGETSPDASAVARAAAALGRELSPAQADVLAGYLALLTRFRRKINLVGPADWQTMLETLVADSWHLADFLAGPGAAFLPAGDAPVVGLDFGAGAGLPGIPLRAFYDRGPYYLLESREKRCVFLAEAAARLGLTAGLRVAPGRVERTVPPILAAHPGAFMLCLGRAFAPWPQFLSLCRELVRAPMAVVTMTGEAPTQAQTPPGFSLAAAASYAVAGKRRYVSLFSCCVATM